MKKTLKRIFVLILSLAIVFTTVATGLNDVSVFAVSQAGTTEDIDDAEEASVNEEVVFVSVANGNYVTASGVKNDDILVDQKFSSVDDVVRKGFFTTYHGTYANNGLDNVEKEVVNFTTSSKSTVWKADDEDIVYQYETTVTDSYSPTGWESVIIQHNNDGTISFASSADEKLFTIEEFTGDDNESHTRLAVSEKYHLGDTPTDSEKFVMYTANAPKKARKVTLSNVAGDCVDVSWTVPDEQMYACFEVFYATSENGNYVSAGLTTDTKITVTGLKSQQQYYFKVRTLTNTKGTSSYSAYSDSAIAYTTTLSASKPAQVEITDIERNESTGALTITWNTAANAKSYNIYKSTGRYAEYEYVTSTSSTTYTDNSPNTESKYKNYYKVESVNGNVTGEMSEPYSLEIDEFGENVFIFNDTDDTDAIADKVDEIYQNQHYNQFGSERYTFAFKEGDYTDMTDSTYNIGYYTQIIGLGKTPYDVRLKNVQTPAALANGNVTCNFWVNIENLTIANTVPEGENFDYWEDSFKWAVSQAAPARRLNVERQTLLQWTWGDNAWASGGYIADSIFQDAVGSWCQQQYYYRNCEFSTDTNLSTGAVYGVNWNQMLQGCENVDSDTLTDNSGYAFNAAGSLLEGNGVTNWGVNGATTVIDETDYVREKPFLYFDSDSDEYKVFVPSVQEDTTGVSWSETSMGTGISLGLDSFYIADPDTDTSATLNEALGKGYNLILQPGIYELDEALEITYENTIVLGLGMATLTPTDKNTDTLVRVAGKKWNSTYTDYTNVDIGGVEIAGIILDAGTKTDTLIEVGYEGANVDHSTNPCVLQDVICRVGGTGDLGTTGSCIVVNSNNTIIDQTWIWRADHGDNTGWYVNTADNGLVVNGDNVTAYGLFVEHFQEYDVIWRGEYGKTYFLQNEKCYDPQSQDEWMSHNGTVNGYASYKITNNVQHHYAVGLGIYDVFINTNGAEIFLDNAIEAPNAEDVLIENATIVEIANGSGPTVGINSIINGTGYGITTGADSKTVSGKQGGYALQRLLYYRNGVSSCLPDDYDYNTDEDAANGISAYPIDSETGLIAAEVTANVEQPDDDTDAEKTIQKETLTVDTSEILGTSETDDDYFEEKIKRCTEEWNKINAASGNSATEKTSNTTTEDNVKGTSYSVKVGDQYTVGDFIYEVTGISGKAGTSMLIGVVSSKKDTMTTAKIPTNADYNGYSLKVTAVGTKAMAKLKKLKKVVFGKNVTKIGKGAFQGCVKLKKIKFKNVKTIGTKAFYNCKKLTKLTIGSKTTKIGKKAFAKCKKLKKVTFGKKVKNIKAKAFAKDNKIKKITFKGKALKKVKKNAFSTKVKTNMVSKATQLKGKKKSVKVLKKKLKIK